ncbi:histidinol-phosphatase HisJ [Aquibacillus sediminis]|uniref:histidinol-phosphatase HisJ n=1 Tax=Aquibacillus sediminis TaxID=2574734 RepID=UPI001107D085|nr:histidinol-phosphatase HisJ [Aquibacillus sediminis]
MQLQGDFHVHTNFCPHGASDNMEAYVQAAIKQGLEYITFTEHAPLPKGFIDPTPEQDSAMSWEDVEVYLHEATRLKEKYEDLITINAGFELDYIEGFEKELTAFIDSIGETAYYSILSIHMLKAPNGEYVCIDYSADEFKRITELFGSVDAVYQTYYLTMEKLLNTDFGNYRPDRIGHLTLIEKFSKLYTAKQAYTTEIINLLETIQAKGFELDANTAGFFKPYCGTCYPNATILQKAYQMNIPLVFGSDSHQAKDIARGSELLPDIETSLPRSIRQLI